MRKSPPCTSWFIRHSATLICILLFLPLLLQAQHDIIRLGKRKNMIWDREISPANLGSFYTYYYPVYYKTTEHDRYRKAGVFGGNIKPDLRLGLPEVRHSFRRFKHRKQLSYLLLGGAVASLAGWCFVSVNDIVNDSETGVNSFFKPRSLPLLGSYFACFYGSIYLNLKADLDLKKCVYQHNRASKSN